MKANTLLNWIPETQVTNEIYTSPVYNMENSTKALAFQVQWSDGLTGTFKWQAAIVPDLWEDYVSCEPVVLSLDGTEQPQHSIIALPDSFLVAAFIRLIFIPANTTGTFNVALRRCPY